MDKSVRQNKNGRQKHRPFNKLNYIIIYLKNQYKLASGFWARYAIRLIYSVYKSPHLLFWTCYQSF